MRQGRTSGGHTAKAAGPTGAGLHTETPATHHSTLGNFTSMTPGDSPLHTGSPPAHLVDRKMGDVGGRVPSTHSLSDLHTAGQGLPGLVGLHPPLPALQEGVNAGQGSTWSQGLVGSEWDGFLRMNGNWARPGGVRTARGTAGPGRETWCSSEGAAVGRGEESGTATLQWEVGSS